MQDNQQPRQYSDSLNILHILSAIESQNLEKVLY